MERQVLVKVMFLKNGKHLVFGLLLIIIVMGSILRFYDLGSKSFWGDELLSLRHAERIIDLKAFFSPLEVNAHPPLYFLLLKIWLVSAQGEFYSRILSVIFGILLILATFLLGRQFVGSKASLIAAFLVAISPLHILYDREVRMYSLFTFFSVVSLYFFIRALRGGENRMWVGYTVFTILNTYTHYHAFLLIFSQWVFFICRYKCYKPFLVKALVSQVAIASAFVFWLPVFWVHLNNYSALGGEPTRFPSTFGVWVKPLYLFFAFSVGQTVLPWNYMIVVPALIIFPLAFISGLKSMIKDKEAGQFFAFFLIVPILTGLFISDIMPRYFIFIAPIYTLVIARGLSALRSRTLQFVATGVVTILLTVPLINYYTNKDFHIMAHVDPWREIGQYLKQNVKEKDLVFNVGGGPINYYTGFDLPVLGNNCFDQVSDKIINGGRKFERIWLILTDPRFKAPGEKTANWLGQRFFLVLEKKFAFDPDSEKKRFFLKKDFLEYRIRVMTYKPKN